MCAFAARVQLVSVTISLASFFECGRIRELGREARLSNKRDIGVPLAQFAPLAIAMTRERVRWQSGELDWLGVRDIWGPPPSNHWVHIRLGCPKRSSMCA